MKCPFCAEEIQDEAILCRHCHAKRVGDGWIEPGAPRPQGRKPNAEHRAKDTWKGLGYTWIAGGVIVLVMALFGASVLRFFPDGIAGTLYQLTFATIVLLLGYSCLRRHPRAVWLTYLAVAIFASDRAYLALSSSAREEAIGGVRDSVVEALEAASLEIDVNELDAQLQWAVQLGASLEVLAFLGLAVFVWVRRRELRETSGH